MYRMPVVEYRDEQLYAAIRKTITMKEIPDVLPPLVPEVAVWLAKNGIPEYGPPFFRYLSCNGDQATVEVGIPVRNAIRGNGHILAGSFPAGRYLKLVYMGHYSYLKDAHMFLESWARKNGLELQQSYPGKGVAWGGRTEFYINDWEEEPDPGKWQTDVLFLLTDD